MRPRFALAGAGAATFFLAAQAGAYCRTTTEKVPPNYNPVVSGCLGGTPLAWTTLPVTFQIYRGASARAPLAVATPIIERSFAKWTVAACGAGPGASHPGLEIEDLGPTLVVDPCDASPCELEAGATSAIYFRDDAWPYSDTANEIALTTVTYGVDDGRIFSAVMELNSLQHVFSTSEPAPAGEISLEAAVTHEAGHFLGLAHSADSSAIMYAYYQGDQVLLTADDAAGVCAIYPPAAPAKGSCDASARGGGGWPAGAALAIAFALAHRRRRA